MNQEQFAKIKACVIDCGFYFATGQEDAPTKEELAAEINMLNASEVMALHKCDKDFLSHDDVVRTIFRKHGL